MQMVRFRSSSDQTYQTVKADINEILQRRAKHWKAVEVTRGDTEHKSEDNLNMNYECFAKCAQDKFETKDVKRPVQRRFVKIPCPMHKCDQERPCDWLCANCAAPLEYGFTDDYIYCGCGRSLYMHWAFKCDKRTHGVDFCEHESSTLLAMLRSLKPFSWLNILILGETGVGKSTFINALVNYLEFEKFDDALDSGDLISLVPSSFSIQNMHDKDPDKEIEETIIQTGSRPDEDNRSTGQSATQQTNVYPVTFSSGPKIYGVRLIDTPGIGDTRGIQYDKKNMADILSTMNTYDELHGILILSKPNSSRLTSTFEYCMKELLTYLHQSAAANIVFGFTNSRASLYTPGDTFNTLKTMISKSDGMGLKLTQRVIYCFDSESFRYLAAYKQDVKLNDKKEFENSWDQSRQETQRMLDHFRTIQPHKTQSTMSLNGAREIIMALTKPMAEISRLITTNIAVCEEQRKAMKTKHFTGEELKKRLHVQIIEMRSEPLPHPRTVCTNVRCKKIQDDGTNRTEKYTIYKTHCHPVCSLANVPIDVLAPESLRGCTAFDLGRRDTCLECGHHWQEHMHVTYELKQYNKMVVDEKIQMKLDANTNDVILRETAIAGYDQRIKEYKEERAIIRHATAAFGVFLKKYAITPYNDAAASYTEFMIQAEKDKIQVGGSRKNLLILEQNLRMHKEEVASIEASMCLDPTSVDISEGAVDRTVKSLFALKHFGRNLKKLQKDTSFAHKSTYREIPYQVRRKTVDSKRGNKGKDKFSVPLQDAPRRGSTWWFNS
jgi:GTPase SAR1 family protein